MGVSAAAFYAPLLGNARSDPGDSSRGAARVVPGISDRSAAALGLRQQRAVPLSVIDPHGPASSRLRRAVSGVFRRTEAVRDAAAELVRLVDEGTRLGNQLNADDVVGATQRLASAVNDLLEFVDANPDSLAAGLRRTVDSATDSASLQAALRTVGVFVDDGGAIGVDAEVLKENLAAQPDFVASTLGRAGGFAQRELAGANSVLEGATVAVVGFSSTFGGSFLLSDANRTRWELSGRFVDLLI